VLTESGTSLKYGTFLPNLQELDITDAITMRHRTVKGFDKAKNLNIKYEI
jgi:hypothetical protein